MKLLPKIINRSIRWKFLLPLGAITLLVTIAVITLLIKDDQGRLQMVAKRRGELLIHSIYSTSYVLRTRTVFQRYVQTLAHHPGIVAISFYSERTNKIIASTKQYLVGKAPEEIPDKGISLSQINATKKGKTTLVLTKRKPEDLVFVAGHMPSYPGKRNPTDLGNSIVLLTFHRSYFEGIVTDLTTRLIFILLLEISALALAVIWVSNQVIIGPTKVLLKTLDAWSSGDRTFPAINNFDEIGDISRHMHATLRALDESNQQVKDITKAINHHAIVSIADKDGRITYVNDLFCEISKYSREELLGQDHRIINSGHHSTEFMAGLWGTISSGNVWNQEIKNRAKDGSEYWVATTIVPFVDHMGKPKQYISIRTDITETKATEAILRENELKLEEALAAAEAAAYAKTQFLANMSHEIRTPLTSIIGFAEAAREHGVSSDERVVSLDRILNSGKHLLGVINDILDLSKIDAGALKVEMQRCSPVTLIENVKTLMLPRIAEKGLTLTINYSWPLPATIISDSLRLMQILVNLVSNAIKFTDRGEVSISVACDRENEKMLFSVADTGIGIAPEEISLLFRPFSQTDLGATRKFGGTGLGLFISKSLATMLGGEISVTSKPKAGSIFSFSISTNNLSEEEWISSIPQTTPTPEVNRSTLSKLKGKVLIVDDSEENRALIEFCLRNTPLSMKMAENGQQAVEAALSDTFDLIIMDMQMPVMDGYEATRIIRKHGVKVPIVAFTAAIMKNDILNCTEAGCSSHLAKPFDQGTLIDCLSKYLLIDSSEDESSKIEVSRTPTTLLDARSIHLSFLSGLEKRVKAISEAINERNFPSLQKAAHKLGGSAGLFGYPALARICAQLENDARANDLDVCQTSLDQINSIYTVIMQETDALKNKAVSFNDIGQRVDQENLTTKH